MRIFWHTSEWKQIREEFNLDEITFCQGHQGGFAVKPMTMAGNLEVNIEGHKMKCKDPEMLAFQLNFPGGLREL